MVLNRGISLVLSVVTLLLIVSSLSYAMPIGSNGSLPPAIAEVLPLKYNIFQRLKAESEGRTYRLPSQAYITGTRALLILLVSFDDAAIRDSELDWASKAFSNNTRSITHFYKEVSNGIFTFAPAQESYGVSNNGVIKVTLSQNHPSPTSISDTTTHEAIKNAILAADPYIDFSAYDFDSNGCLSYDELTVLVVFGGYERSYYNSCSPSIWAHRWYLAYTTPPTVDGVIVGTSSCDAKKSGYVVIGEYHGSCSNNHSATLGIMVHELGHTLGLPDFYDTSGQTNGIGVWGLMAGGSWGMSYSDSYLGQTPVPLSIFSKWYLGWANSAYLSPTQNTRIFIYSTSNTAYIIKLDNDEYLFLEYRKREGYNAGYVLASGAAYPNKDGLLVLRAYDSKLDTTNWRYNTINASGSNGTDHGLAVIELDGNSYGKGDLWDRTYGNRGDVDDLMLYNAITPTSTPKMITLDNTILQRVLSIRGINGQDYIEVCYIDPTIATPTVSYAFINPTTVRFTMSPIANYINPALEIQFSNTNYLGTTSIVEVSNIPINAEIPYRARIAFCQKTSAWTSTSYIYTYLPEATIIEETNEAISISLIPGTYDTKTILSQLILAVSTTTPAVIKLKEEDRLLDSRTISLTQTISFDNLLTFTSNTTLTIKVEKVNTEAAGVGILEYLVVFFFSILLYLFRRKWYVFLIILLGLVLPLHCSPPAAYDRQQDIFQEPSIKLVKLVLTNGVASREIR